MKHRHRLVSHRVWIAGILLLVASAVGLTSPANAVTVDGTDVIFLAGRTDVTIQPLGGASPPLLRHGFVLGTFLLETFPDPIAAVPGEIFSFSATGGIHYFNGNGGPFFGPDGNGTGGSNLNSLGGISGYKGPQGPLVGVFLDGSVPSSGPAPATLDFTLAGLGTGFTGLSPALRQIFFVGDGLTGTGSGSTQTFTAPTGTSRLFLGIADGFSFSGDPGYYEDNDGASTVEIRSTRPSIPEPASLVLLVAGLAGMGGMAWRRR